MQLAGNQLIKIILFFVLVAFFVAVLIASILWPSVFNIGGAIIQTFSNLVATVRG